MLEPLLMVALVDQ